MASTRTTRKKTGTQRSVGAKKSTKAVKRTPARKADDKRTGAKRKTFVKNEAAAVLAILAALFLLLSGFGLFGAAGSFLFGIEKGLFGLAAYVFPLLIVLLVYLYMMQAGNALFPLKCASSVLLYFMLCAFLQLFAGGEPAEEGYFAASRQAVHGIGGGLFGGMISGSLSGAVGSVGTFLILLAVSIVCLVVLTEKSFLEALRSGSDAAGRAFSEGHERYREIREEQRIRAEARREENRLRRKERSFDDQDLNLRKRQETEEGEDLFSVNDPFGTAVAKGKPAAATAAAAAIAVSHTTTKYPAVSPVMPPNSL